MRAEKLLERKKANKISMKSDSVKSKELKSIENAQIEEQKLSSVLMDSSERARLGSQKPPRNTLQHVKLSKSTEGF